MRIKSISHTKLDAPVKVYDVINAAPYHNFLINTETSAIVSHNCAIMDEVSFAPGQDVSYEKTKIMSIYTNIRRRMESRFMVQGINYGLMFLVSSKNTESSFLEAYIADQVKKGYPIYVVDKPLWEVKPGAYSGEKFKVAVGNKYVPSRICPPQLSDNEISEWAVAAKTAGLRIIDVPVEHRQAFDQNLDKALQDIAGISTSTVTKAFSVQRIELCISETLVNPFKMDILTIGLHDDLKIQDFFDAAKIPDNVKGAPIFIHIDTSVKGDRTGISGVGIIGSKQSVAYTTEIDSQELVDELICQQVFSVAIQAPSDSEISFEKTRQFLYYLRDVVGLNIKIISTDGFNSVDLRQILQVKGFNTGYTSLDRTPDGYDSLRSAINDKRIILLKGCNLLVEELSELERDNNTHKYDHPSYGSKDCADSLAGAFYDALQYKDEYLFFHPDDYEYEDINNRITDEEKLRNSMLQDILGHKIATESMKKLFPNKDDEDDDDSRYHGYDDNILLL